MKSVCKQGWLWGTFVLLPAACIATFGSSKLPTTAATKRESVILDGLVSMPAHERETFSDSEQTVVIKDTVGSTTSALPAFLPAGITAVFGSSGATADREEVRSATSGSSVPTGGYVNRVFMKKTVTFSDSQPRLKTGTTLTTDTLSASVTFQTEVTQVSAQFQTTPGYQTGAVVFPVSEKDVSTSTDSLSVISGVHNRNTPMSDDWQTMTTHNELLLPTGHPWSEQDKDVTSLAESFRTTVKARVELTATAGPPELTSLLQRTPIEADCNRFSCYCSCTRRVAKCSGHEKYPNYLPALPPCIRTFRTTGGVLSTLTRHILAKLSNVNITALHLPSNRISGLEPDTFADFQNLEDLDLSDNPIPVSLLMASLNGLHSGRFQKLSLNKMGLTSLPGNIFHVFTNKSVKAISLSENQLQSFDSIVFTPFQKVKYVILKMNAIFRLNISTRVHITSLNLEENKLSDFPNLCLYKSPTAVTSAFHNLLSLYVGGNPFPRIPPGSLLGVCLPSLLKLDIKASPKITRLENNFVADLPRLENLVVERMRRLRVYEPLAFNSSSLRELTLRDNPRMKSMSEKNRLSFKYCVNLEKLVIVDTHLAYSETMMEHVSHPLANLRELQLQKVNDRVLVVSLIRRNPKLEKLVLTSNGITSDMLARALQNVTSLRHLNLRSNLITVVNETTLPWSCRQHLKHLDIGHNPFRCSCEQRWFKRWLDDVTRNKSVHINSYRKYKCDSPETRRGLRLYKLQFKDGECTIKALNLGLLLGVSFSCVLTFMVVVLGMVYRYRWYLRFFLYRCRRHRSQKCEGDIRLFQYDMYVAYSPDDLDWLYQELKPLLEEEHGLNLFLLDRDTMPGTVIADNIPRYMDLCGRILVLLSDKYVREHWRLYEFEHIVYAAIEQEKDIIVVLLGEVEAGRTTKDMRRMLTRGTFLQWGSSEEGKRVFREGLRVALKTENVFFQTMC